MEPKKSLTRGLHSISVKIITFSSFAIVFSMPSLAFRVDALHFPLLSLLGPEKEHGDNNHVSHCNLTELCHIPPSIHLFRKCDYFTGANYQTGDFKEI